MTKKQTNPLTVEAMIRWLKFAFQSETKFGFSLKACENDILKV
ncbi:hypothetical protein QUF64_13295 [Anaerolineales bacterium HSG6]|nr:hypothetical protein [Anaerolineales bacterium HSG6]MDM8532459.1 hypothetical protein [Anaerolineales bacterium HSG25]